MKIARKSENEIQDIWWITKKILDLKKNIYKNNIS